MPSERLVNVKDQSVAVEASKSLTLERAVGRVFAELRESSGLKQVDVSVATGYVERTVGMVERGEKSPTLRTMANFASFYGIPLEEIIIRAKRLKDPRA